MSLKVGIHTFTQSQLNIAIDAADIDSFFVELR